MKQTSRETGRTSEAARRRRVAWAVGWLLLGLVLSTIGILGDEGTGELVLVALGGAAGGFGGSWLVTLVRNARS